MVSDNGLVALPPPLSVNLTVKLAVPVTVGVPLMAPVDAARLKPCGNAPCDIDQVTGETAPDTASIAEYAEPFVPFGNVVVVITGLEVTVIVRLCVSVAFAASRTRAVNWDVPRFCGVPLMAPSLLSASPVGSAPADTEKT